MGSEETLLPSFFEEYAASVCAHAHDPMRCMDSAIFPPPDQQREALALLDGIAAALPLREARGAVLQLLLQGDTEQLQSLLHAIHDYYDSLDTIRAITESLLS